MTGNTNSENNRRTPSGPCPGSVPPLLTLEDVNAIQDEASRTYRQYQNGGIRGQGMSMYDMWDYHLIMATLNFKEQNDSCEQHGT